MAKLFPFKPLLPNSKKIEKIASKPYDVLSYEEAKEEISKNPFSYLNITRPDALFNNDEDFYSQKIYDKAKEQLKNFIANNTLLPADKEAFYIYRLEWKGKKQTGLVALSSVEDYNKNIIKKHELTRTKKENDRINHMFTIKAQTGNVFLAYKDEVNMVHYLDTLAESKAPMYDFRSDGIQNTIWVVDKKEDIHFIQENFKTNIPFTYIADGHHRVASACKLVDRKNYPCSSFLTTLFATKELSILPYHRILKGIEGFHIEAFKTFLNNKFIIKEIDFPTYDLDKKQLGFYHDTHFYLLEQTFSTSDFSILESLDVNILQKEILHPFFNIEDIRTDERIDFVGGIRGNKFVKNLVDNSEVQMAFFTPAVTVDDLIAIADNDAIMPPKSTWFEPKLKDGLFTHII